MSVVLEGRRNDSGREERSLTEAYAELRGSAARLVTAEGGMRELPESLLEFLGRLTVDLSARRTVAIVGNESTMTTVEACQLLGVSRQHLVNLLESGAIPFHKVGTHRRIYASDVFRYKSGRDRQRREAIRQFSALERDSYLDS